MRVTPQTITFRNCLGGNKIAPAIQPERLFVLALSIFTCSRPHTIVDELELNFCVRDGNRWTLKPINTNYSRIVP